MNREEALNKLEAKILEMISKLGSLEKENASLRKALAEQKSIHDSLKEQIRIGAEELENEVKRLKVFRDSLKPSQGD